MLNYTSYLKVNELLSLQQPLSDGPEHDELLFITIHQVYELWFKQLRHETNGLCLHFSQQKGEKALATLQRVRTILKTLVSQVDILETMTPLSFRSFRDRLETSSGFQSYQFRMVEFAWGAKEPRRLEPFVNYPNIHQELVDIINKPSVFDVFLNFLKAESWNVPNTVLRRDVSKVYTGDQGVEEVLLEIYRKDPRLSLILEALVDVDEGLQEWRYRHVKMVERTIGHKVGTGGSPGASYLKTTLFNPLFPDLWELRSKM